MFGWRLEENCFHVITGGIKSFNKKISSHLWNAFSIVCNIFMSM